MANDECELELPAVPLPLTKGTELEIAKSTTETYKHLLTNALFLLGTASNQIRELLGLLGKEHGERHESGTCTVCTALQKLEEEYEI